MAERSVTTEKNRITYIDPNELVISKYQKKHNTNENIYNLQWNPDDLNIYVDLKVFVPHRGDCGKVDYRAKMEKYAQYDYLSFLGGQKVNLGNGKKSDEGYLTTDYTEISYHLIEDNKQNEVEKETLGINSIDINFDAHFFPLVTIKFTDVRGASLLDRSEFQYISSLKKLDAPGSFFASLFHFPYPRFLLTVKGFYGTKVTFILAVHEFKSDLNPDTGDFNITISFIGYIYGLYTDVPMELLIAAPYYNTDYWEKKTGMKLDSDESLEGDSASSQAVFKYSTKDGNGAPIMTYIQFLEKYMTAESNVNYDDLQNNDAVSDYVTINRKLEALNEIEGAFNDFLNELSQTNSNNFIKIDGKDTNNINNISLFCFKNNDESINLRYIYRNNEISEGCSTKYKEFIDKYGDFIKTYDDIEVCEDEYMLNCQHLNNITEISNEIKNNRDNFLKNAIFFGESIDLLFDKKSDDGVIYYLRYKDGLNIDNLEDEVKSYCNLLKNSNLDSCLRGNGNKIIIPSNANFFFVYYTGKGEVPNGYQVTNKSTVLRWCSSLIDSLDSNREQQAQEASEVVNEEYTKALGFEPTLDNVYRMIFVHLDTFIDFFNNKILDDVKHDMDGGRRKPNSLGLNSTNSDIFSNRCTAVYPFPAYYVKNENNINYQEYPGLSKNETLRNIAEVKHIQEIIDSIIKCRKAINDALQVINDSTTEYGGDGRNGFPDDLYPLSPLYAAYGANQWVNIQDKLNQGENDVYVVVYNFLCLMLADNSIGVGNNNYGFCTEKYCEYLAKNFFKSNLRYTNSFKTIINQLLQSYDDSSDTIIGNIVNFGGNGVNDNQILKLGGYISLAENNNNQEQPIAILFDSPYNINGEIVTIKKKNNPIEGNNYKSLMVTYEDTSGNRHSHEMNLHIPCDIDSDTFKNHDLLYGKTNSEIDAYRKRMKNFYKETYNDSDVEYGKEYIEVNGSYSTTRTNLFKNNLDVDQNNIIKLSYDKAVDSDTIKDIIINNSSSEEYLVPFVNFNNYNFFNKNENGNCDCVGYKICKNGDRVGTTSLSYILLASMVGNPIIAFTNIKNALKNTDISLCRKIDLLYCGAYFHSENNTLFRQNGVVGSGILDGIENKIFVDDVSLVKGDIITNDGTFFMSKTGFNNQGFDYYVTRRILETYFIEWSNKTFTQEFVNTMINPNDDEKATYDLNIISDTKIIGYKHGSRQEKFLRDLYLESINILTLKESTVNDIKSGSIKRVLNALKNNSDEDNNDNNNDDNYSVNNQTTNQKRALYYTLKSLYDKWLATYTAKEFQMHLPSTDFALRKKRFSSLTVGRDDDINEFNNFVFVDQYYNDISCKYYVDPKIIYDVICEPFINGRMKQSIYEVMAAIAQKSELLMFALPVYNNLYNSNSIIKVFEPNTGYDANNYDRGIGNTYVVMYLGDQSKYADCSAYDYQNDFIDLADVLSNDGPIDVFSIKKGENDMNYNISAFGVSYGKQSQSYFKRVMVNMDAPKVTEQSIKNLLMLSDSGSNGDLDVPVSVGQNIYSIYANRSYTCSVEMMGCANITPMMYFQLNNVPLFRGLYMIINVRHSIASGNMTTVFTGVRVSKYAMPDVQVCFTARSLLNRLTFNPYEEYEGSADLPLSTTKLTEAQKNELSRTVVLHGVQYPCQVGNGEGPYIEGGERATGNGWTIRKRDLVVNAKYAQRFVDAFNDLCKDIPENYVGQQHIAISKTGPDCILRPSNIGKPSWHHYAMAIDFVTDTNFNYSGNTTDGGVTIAYSKYADLPDEQKKDTGTQIRTWDHPIVRIMLSHGFGWGIYQKAMDLMHFSLSRSKYIDQTGPNSPGYYTNADNATITKWKGH